MSRRSLQVDRPTSPNVQKTIAAIWSADEKYWRNVVTAVKRAANATPTRIITSGRELRYFATRRRPAVASIAPKKAQMVTRQGFRTTMESEMRWEIEPAPRTVIANAAPNAAAWETPSV